MMVYGSSDRDSVIFLILDRGNFSVILFNLILGVSRVKIFQILRNDFVIVFFLS